MKRSEKMDAILYIHGKGGSAEESYHYKNLFPACYAAGIDYKGSEPWTAGKEIHAAVTKLKAGYDRIILIANSIGAFFAMNSNIDREIFRAFFISPIVDMEKLIADMMALAGVTESELKERGVIHTDFGEDLSWEYLCYVRTHSVNWTVPTDILYGSADNLTSIDTITAFAQSHHASLTIMDEGEHWFHTEEQMQFLDNWIRNNSGS